MDHNGNHTHIEKCTDLKLDFRDLIQRFIGSHLIENIDISCLKPLMNNLVYCISLQLLIKKTVNSIKHNLLFFNIFVVYCDYDH